MTDEVIRRGLSRRGLLQASGGTHRRLDAAGDAGLRRGQAADRHLAGRLVGSTRCSSASAVPRTGTYAVQGEDELKG